MKNKIFHEEDYNRYLAKVEKFLEPNISAEEIIQSTVEEDMDRFGIFAALSLISYNNTTEKDEKAIQKLWKERAILWDALRLDPSMTFLIFPKLDEEVLAKMCDVGIKMMFDDACIKKNREYVLYVINNFPYAQDFILKRYNALLNEYESKLPPLTQQDVYDFVKQDYQLVERGQ